RGLGELEHKARNVVRMDIVPDLFAFITKYLVFAAFEIALDEIAEEAVQFDAGMVGPRETSAAKAARRYIEVTAVLLHHHVRRNFGCAEQRMLALVDRKALADAMLVRGIGIIPSCL